MLMQFTLILSPALFISTGIRKEWNKTKPLILLLFMYYVVVNVKYTAIKLSTILCFKVFCDENLHDVVLPEKKK